MNKKHTTETFSGFPAETFKFLEDLSQNNKKEWFTENRASYERYYLEPAFGFINALGAALSQAVPGLIYEPRVNRSLFRINRDARFSKDKSPYKTHIGMVFWKGPYAEKNSNPGFYIQIEAHRLYFACGTWMPEADMLAEYRESLQDKALSAAFKHEVDALAQQGILLNREYSLKRTPPQFPATHELADYAKLKTVFVETEEIGIPDVAHSASFVDYCMSFFSKSVGLMNWIVDLSVRTHSKG
jgi:uncharacterized protein (TIGR02453 family)